MITPIFCVWILNFTMLDEQVYHATNKGFFHKKFHKFAVDLRKKLQNSVIRELGSLQNEPTMPDVVFCSLSL